MVSNNSFQTAPSVPQRDRQTGQTLVHDTQTEWHEASSQRTFFKFPPRTALFVLLLFTYKTAIDLLASQAKQVNTSICATSKVFSPRPGSGNFKRSCSLSLCAAKTSLAKIA
jgi:hypothetical protein